MTFENNSAPKKADLHQDNWSAELTLPHLAELQSIGPKPELQRTSWEELFGSPVLDARMATQPIQSMFGPEGANVDACEHHKKTTSQKESLDNTKLGDSVLNRMYEVAVLTPKGKVTPDKFAAVYGDAAAKKMSELGIVGVQRNAQNILVNLARALHFGDSSGSIDIGKQVSFTSHPSGGLVALDNMKGVTASNGMFQLPINRVDLQPREHGYLSGIVTAGWSTTRVCAFPDGKIHK